MFDLNIILNRVRILLVNPKAEWEVIRNEKSSVKDLIANYILPFIITIALSSLIGSLIFASFFTFGFKFLSAIIAAISPLLTIYISSLLINELTTSFNSKKDFLSVFKLIMYSYTASLVVSIILNLLPFLSIFGLAGLYSFYIYWIGMPLLLNTSEDKRVGFLIVSALIIIGIGFIISFLLSLLLTPFMISTINL